MYRKEAIVADTVFDLGLQGLEKATADCQRAGYVMELEVAGTVFTVGTSLQEKAVILHWTGQTLYPNIIWRRFVALRFRWPPVKEYTCFTYS